MIWHKGCEQWAGCENFVKTQPSPAPFESTHSTLIARGLSLRGPCALTWGVPSDRAHAWTYAWAAEIPSPRLVSGAPHPRGRLPPMLILQVDRALVQLRAPVDCKLGDARGRMQQKIAA